MNTKIKDIESEIQALRIKDILDSHDIPHIIKSFHDSAYDGLFQNQYGWGVLEADEKSKEEILELLKDISPEN